MIDTIRFRQDYKPLFKLKKKYGLNRIRHNGLIIKADTFAGKIRFIEVSLPKVLYRDNSRLIESPASLQKAFEELDRILSLHAQPTHPKRTFSRVDLVWHFAVRPETFFEAHKFSTYPEIRKPHAIWYDSSYCTGITWAGKQLRIRMYDKSCNFLGKALPILRVEIKLTQNKLQRLLGGGKPVSSLDFDLCYRTYRGLVLKLQPKNVRIITAKDQAFYEAEKAGYTIFPLLTRRKQNDLRRRFAHIALHDFKVSWANLLPKNVPPKPPRNYVRIRINRKSSTMSPPPTLKGKIFKKKT